MTMEELLNRSAKQAWEKGYAEGCAAGQQEGREIGQEIGQKAGQEAGRNSILQLIHRMIQAGEQDKLECLNLDADYLNAQLEKYHL